MDKKTMNALKEIISFAKNATTPTEHSDAHYKAFKQVESWMEEVSKEIED